MIWVEPTDEKIKSLKRKLGINGVKEKIKELLGLANTNEDELRIEIERTPWDITFLRHAIETAGRSHDAETQCGCILVRNKTILSGGYNGFIRDIDDSILPNIKPHKYPYMMHAEINALLNCARNGISTLNSTCYVTTKPCLQCFQFLWQAGISRIVYTDWKLSKNYNHTEANNQIEALHMLMNPGVDVRMWLHFIPKNDVLPK